MGAKHLIGPTRPYFGDDRGVLLRTPWRLEGGSVNISLWRDNVCTETFHLSVAEVPSLVHFLLDGLAEGVAHDRAADAS